jgi:hypothetical protein
MKSRNTKFTETIMKKYTSLISLVLYASFILSACGTGQPFQPSFTPTATIDPTATFTRTPAPTFTPTLTPTPTQPKMGDQLDAGDGLMMTVVEAKNLPEVNLYKNDRESELRSPTSGNTYYAVSAELKLATGTRSLPLNLDNIVLISEDNTKFPALNLTFRDSLDTDLSTWRFMNLDGDGKTLDFGLGFTGLETTMGMQFKDGVGRLSKYYGPSPIILTFLFEIPQTSKVAAFQFNDLAPVLLEK